MEYNYILNFNFVIFKNAIKSKILDRTAVDKDKIMWLLFLKNHCYNTILSAMND